MNHGKTSASLHVAIVMDGNGRWATARARPRTAGHVVGARAARRIVEHARRRGIGTLTLYAFSSDNWQRPRREVFALMRLFRRYLLAETERCIANGIRLSIIGRRDRIAPELRLAIEAAEAATADCRDMHLRVAVDYSARDAILRAAALAQPGVTREQFSSLLGTVDHVGGPSVDVDLLVRTGGEQRLSDYLLWECAYAELYFTGVLWPEFGEADFDDALDDFASRQRRFGGVPEAAAG